MASVKSFTSPHIPSIASACFTNESFSSCRNPLMVPSNFSVKDFSATVSISNGGRRQQRLSSRMSGTDFARPILVRLPPNLGRWGVLPQWILSILSWKLKANLHTCGRLSLASSNHFLFKLVCLIVSKLMVTIFQSILPSSLIHPKKVESHQLEIGCIFDDQGL